jgi:hypothetical protein
MALALSSLHESSTAFTALGRITRAWIIPLRLKSCM